MQVHELPEFYIVVGDDGRQQQITAPAYEALAQIHINWTSPETGQSGPTLLEPGSQFISEAIPGHQWLPLNQAAGERYERWLASLPQSGVGFTQEELTEAAFALRPREGDAEMSHEQWWPAVLKYAAAMKERRLSGLQTPSVRAAVPVRPGGQMPIMPYAQHQQTTLPPEPGRPPAPGSAEHITPAPGVARPVKRKPLMPGAMPSVSPQQATG